MGLNNRTRRQLNVIPSLLRCSIVHSADRIESVSRDETLPSLHLPSTGTPSTGSESYRQHVQHRPQQFGTIVNISLACTHSDYHGLQRLINAVDSNLDPCISCITSFLHTCHSSKSNLHIIILLPSICTKLLANVLTSFNLTAPLSSFLQHVAKLALNT